MQPNIYTPGNIEELRDLLSQPLTVYHAWIIQQAAHVLFSHFILPKIKNDETVWAGQITFPPNEKPVIRLNEDVKGKVRFRGEWKPISQRMTSDLATIEKIQLDESERTHAHVTVFLAKSKDGKTQIKFVSPQLHAIVPAIIRPPIHGIDEIAPKGELVFMNCQNCGNLFLPEPKHPQQKYCSKRCRETAKKRRYRAEKQSSGGNVHN